MQIKTIEIRKNKRLFVNGTGIYLKLRTDETNTRKRR